MNDWTKMSEAALRKIMRGASSRSREFAEARKELNRRAAQDPRNNISLGPKPKLDKRGYERKSK